MGKDSGIQWTDNTLNDWWGCVEVSPGCDHCYAKTLATRFGRNVWGIQAPRYFTKQGFGQALKWQREAEKEAKRARVFTQSMSDIAEVLPVSHPDYSEMYSRRRRFFEEIIPACPNLDFQLLTKRVGNYHKVVPQSWLYGGGWPVNAWAGISVVNQAEANRDIPKLTCLPAPIKFLSVEPQIERIGIERFLPDLQWVIVGGESGNQARPFNPEWARSLVEQCREYGVACFVKQFGAKPVGISLKDNHGGDWDEWPEDLRVREFPKESTT